MLNELTQGIVVAVSPEHGEPCGHLSFSYQRESGKT